MSLLLCTCLFLQNVDGYIGEIMMAFKDAGIYDETLFILTADHGGLVVWY